MCVHKCPRKLASVGLGHDKFPRMITELDSYFDAVPRSDAEPVDGRCLYPLRKPRPLRLLRAASLDPDKPNR